MDKVYDKACRGSEVPLRALWCKARSRGVSLATSHCKRKGKRRRYKRFLVLCRKMKESLILRLLEVTIK
jgi:hypothetical protein